MGRGAEGWKLKTDERTGIKSVRFRHDGKRHDRSTGERDPAKARAEAAKIYARVVSGADARERVAVTSKLSLRELMAAFLEEIEGDLAPDTHAHYSSMALNTVEPFFRELGRFTPEQLGAFVRARLRVTLRASVRGDVKVVRRFLAWAVAKGLLAAAPAFPEMAKGASGTRALNRKAKAIPITRAEALAILAHLPERSASGLPVRARFTVQWETALRQATIGRLRVPEHYRKGATTLLITDPIDKARFGRELPLTDAARAALDSVCPDVGHVFGATRGSVFAVYLRRAAKAAGLRPDAARQFTAYDFRHGRITDLLVGGAPLPAVAFLAGHTQLTTTNAYVQIAQAASAAAEALRNSGGVSGGVTAMSPKKPRRKTA